MWQAQPLEATVANLKARQRVRIIHSPLITDLLGMEGVIESVRHDLPEIGLLYVTRVDGHPNGHDPSGCYGFLDGELAPLTDPDALQFVERIKKLAREPQPVCGDALAERNT